MNTRCLEGEPQTMRKFQAPNLTLNLIQGQTNSNIKIPNSKQRFVLNLIQDWSLGFRICLDFGAWDLEFNVSVQSVEKYQEVKRWNFMRQSRIDVV